MIEEIEDRRDKIVKIVNDCKLSAKVGEGFSRLSEKTLFLIPPLFIASHPHAALVPLIATVTGKGVDVGSSIVQIVSQEKHYSKILKKFEEDAKKKEALRIKDSLEKDFNFDFVKTSESSKQKLVDKIVVSCEKLLELAVETSKASESSSERELEKKTENLSIANPFVTFTGHIKKDRKK